VGQINEDNSIQLTNRLGQVDVLPLQRPGNEAARGLTSVALKPAAAPDISWQPPISDISGEKPGGHGIVRAQRHSGGVAVNKREILAELFAAAPSLISEDDVAENIVIPFLLRLGYESASIRRKVSITGATGRRFRKQADIVVQVGEIPGLVIETKRLSHRLREEDANQALSYAQLLEPAAPIAVLTNGNAWEQYTLSDNAIGGLEDIVEPADLAAIVGRASAAIPRDRREAAERLLVTIEEKPALEAAFRQCRQVLAKEGLIAEGAFDELTKVLVCKFNEEKRFSDDLGTYRFTSAWLRGSGGITGLAEMFTDAKQTFRVFPPGTQIDIRHNETVEEIVRQLEPFGFYGFKTPLGLAGAGGDVVGSVYETFLTGTLRGDLGQYLTPRQIIEFMVDIAEIQPGDRVLDLACGSGGFLIRAFQRIRKRIRSMHLPDEEKQQLEAKLVSDDLWGVEINPRLATLCRINLILHGDGYEHIYTGDSIRESHFENTEGRRVDLKEIERGDQPKFDVILMNPPFNLPYEDGTVLNRYELGRGKGSQGSDYLMLERALRLLKDTGRLLIVMPHGVASGSSDKDIREFVKSQSHLHSCTSLPVGAFKSFGGSNARTAILHLAKKPTKERFLAQAEAVGYDVTSKHYREIMANDLPDILDTYEEFQASK
jgi:type I restriction enzyme M protein